MLVGGKARPDLGPYFYEPTLLEGVTPEVAKEAMKLAAQKLCILTKFVSRHSELR